MTVETDFDRTALIADFGIDVDISGQRLKAIFDNEWQDLEGISVSIPILTMKTSDVSAVVRGQVVYVGQDSDKYTVQETMPDGQGITMLMLQAE